MARIIEGTTPTIKYTFTDIDTSNIQVAYLTIKGKNSMLKKSLEDATVSNGMLTWHLTQEETLAVGVGDAKIMCNTLLADGTRTASAETDVKFTGNHIPEVI